jgi:hypothetical protein
MRRVLSILAPLLLAGGVAVAAAQRSGIDGSAPGRVAKPGPWSLEMRLSSVFDSNLDRDEESLDVYGLVAGAQAMFERRRDDDDLRLEYEAALHRYSRTDKWDRLSHKLRGRYEREVGSRWTLGAESEITIKGSSEDRTVGDQYILEPRLEYEIADDSEARVYGAFRLRRYDQEPEQNAVNRYAGAEFTQKFGGKREWEVGLRYEVNDAERSRRYYRRWTWHTRLVTPLSARDELELELKLRARVFPERFVEMEDELVPRQDRRWSPSLVWTRALSGSMGLEVEYEYETRSSNDPEQAFKGHQLRLSLLFRAR